MVLLVYNFTMRHLPAMSSQTKSDLTQGMGGMEHTIKTLPVYSICADGYLVPATV